MLEFRFEYNTHHIFIKAENKKLAKEEFCNTHGQHLIEGLDYTVTTI